jgi:UDP-N-acetylglucosamine 2-epimerase
MRGVTERPAALEGGTVKLVGAHPDNIFKELAHLLEDSLHYGAMARVQNPFGDGTSTQRIVDAIWNFFQSYQLSVAGA